MKESTSSVDRTDKRSFRERLREVGSAAKAATDASAGAAENFDLTAGLSGAPHLRLRERATAFSSLIEARSRRSGRAIERQAVSAADREVEVLIDRQGEPSRALMFASNNYLGFANDPYVKAQVQRAVDKWGVGAGGPPQLNGYSGLLAEVEGRLARLKGTEDCLIFSSGYGANVALMNALARSKDRIFFDALSHASFIDGLRMTEAQARPFGHNDLERLEALLAQNGMEGSDTFVAVEGVYSMEGDIAPLREVAALTRKYDAFLIVDDAHGTGVLGAGGSGTGEHCGVHGEIDLVMGTFSKVFAVTGGFLAGSRELIRYLRFTARSYVFSAAPAPSVLAAVNAGLDLLEQQPERRDRLFENVEYVASRLRSRDFDVPGHTPILAVLAPREMDVDRACARFQKLGIFVSAIEYPAVPRSSQRFRISIMATHRREDLDRLLAAFDDVFGLPGRSV